MVDVAVFPEASVAVMVTAVVVPATRIVPARGD